jgi:hypothetical protein
LFEKEHPMKFSGVTFLATCLFVLMIPQFAKSQMPMPPQAPLVVVNCPCVCQCYETGICDCANCQCENCPATWVQWQNGWYRHTNGTWWHANYGNYPADTVWGQTLTMPAPAFNYQPMFSGFAGGGACKGGG